MDKTLIIEDDLVLANALLEHIASALKLEMSAEEFITRSFDMRELASRVEALLERASDDTKQELRFGPMTIEPFKRRVTINGVNIELTFIEFMMLRFLAQNAGRAVSREELIARVWGRQALNQESTVTVHLSRLRRKLQFAADLPKFIKTIRGQGYRFASADELTRGASRG